MMKLAVLPSVAMLLWATAPLRAQEPAAPSPAEAGVYASAPAYVQAFNARDSQALAEQWSPEAVYLNRSTGEEVVGREAIAAQFDALFQAQPDLKLDVNVESIRFLSPNVAVEQGTSTFLAPDAEPEEIDYTAVYVQRDGKWLLDRVTDDEREASRSHYEQLQPLEWLVGNWVDQDEDARIDFECSWAKNQNFLIRSFTVAVENQIDLSGMQIIGWDAGTAGVRSWTFDSDGGFAEATWTRHGDKWFISNKGVLADGRTITMVNVVKPVDEDSFTWQTIERTVGGELLPNVDEVTIVRQ
jgi:uncharacterized protein (TIGR02246 family)